jgi:hypothetical protein
MSAIGFEPVTNGLLILPGPLDGYKNKYIGCVFKVSQQNCVQWIFLP